MLKPIELKNGLTVLRIPKNNSEVFSSTFIIPSGSGIEEGYFQPGTSHLIEKLFWAGTDKHPSKKKLNLELEGMGGDFSSFTSQEMMGFTISVPKNHQKLASGFLAEIVQRSYFDERDIDKEKKQLMSTLKESLVDVKLEADQLAITNLYPHSSLGSPIEGTIETVSNINQNDILEYLSHQLRPDKCYLVISGNFENKSVMEVIEQEWSIWNPKVKNFIEQLPFSQEDVGELPRTVYRQRGIAQTFLHINFLLSEGLKPSPIVESESDSKEKELNYEKILQDYLKRNADLIVLNTILGGGLSSRLWTKSVEEELLFSTIDSQISKFHSTGYLQISGEIENTQFSFGLESILGVLEALKKTTISMNELSKAKAYIKGRLIREHEDIQTAVLWKVENLLGSSLNYDLDDLLKAIDEVSISDIRSKANEVFIPENLLISTYGPAKETRLVDKLIRKYLQ